jgi:hypothetical protein
MDLIKMASIERSSLKGVARTRDLQVSVSAKKLKKNFMLVYL